MSGMTKYDFCGVCEKPLDGRTGHPKPPGKGKRWAHKSCKISFIVWSEENWDMLPDQSVFRK